MVQFGQSERGAIAVLAAFMALLLFLVIIALGIDTTLIKHLRQELEQKVEVACHQASYLLPLQARAYESFSDQINALSLKYGQLDTWRVYLPTPPDDPLEGFLSVAELQNLRNCGGDIDGFEPDGGAPENMVYNLSELCLTDPPRFKLGPIDSETGLQDRPAYPASFWNAGQYFGNVIGCEARATYRPFWGLSGPDSQQSVVVRSIWWKPLIGPQFDYRVALSGTANPRPPRLTIAIAPHMQTDFQDPRFRFSGLGGLQNFNPHRSPSDPPAHFYFNEEASNQRDYGFVNDSAGNAVRMGGHQPLTDSEADQLATACYNPAVLVRNAFTATIAELASRHGHTVNNTEILIAGTRPVPLWQNNPAEWLPQPPIRLFHNGSDLSYRVPFAGIGVQLPYISYFDGVLDSGVAVGEWVYPFRHLDSANQDQTGRDSQAQELAFIRSAQLRACIRGYQTASAENRVSFWPDFESMVLLEQQFFEPPRYLDRDPPFGDDQLLLDWEQECTYGTLPGVNSCATGEHVAKSTLTAVQALYSLGSIQRCPHGPASGSGPCNKPLDQTQELRPDLSALVDYINRLVSDGGSLADSAAIFSPGVWPISGPDYNDKLVNYLELPFEVPAGQRDDALDNSSLVLVVLHRPPFDQAEAEQILADVRSAGTDRRWIVVYIPTNQADAENFGLVTTAFDLVSDGLGQITPATNLFFMFQPYSRDADGAIVPDSAWDGGSADESSLFQRYWESLLLGDEDDSIVERAINIWNLAFVDTRRKL